jgi:hypothetical protein
MSTLTLTFRVRLWHNQAEKLCFNKKVGLRFNKNRFSITLLITVQNFRQRFHLGKKIQVETFFPRFLQNKLMANSRFMYKDHVNTKPKNHVLTKKADFLLVKNINYMILYIIITVNFVVNSYSLYMRQYVEISTRHFCPCMKKVKENFNAMYITGKVFSRFEKSTSHWIYRKVLVI